MRNDSLHGGQQAYLDVKRSLIRGQRDLCAYCEIRLADGLDDQAIDAKRHEQRVEHFHPKSDNSDPLNWALHWLNLWAVCLGGSDRPPAGVPADPLRFQEPLPANLSCDAFKEGQIERGRLPASPEGWILSPDEVPAFPILFQYAPSGMPEPTTDPDDPGMAPPTPAIDPAPEVAVFGVPEPQLFDRFDPPPSKAALELAFGHGMISGLTPGVLISVEPSGMPPRPDELELNEESPEDGAPSGEVGPMPGVVVVCACAATIPIQQPMAASRKSGYRIERP